MAWQQHCFSDCCYCCWVLCVVVSLLFTHKYSLLLFVAAIQLVLLLLLGLFFVVVFSVIFALHYLKFRFSLYLLTNASLHWHCSLQ